MYMTEEEKTQKTRREYINDVRIVVDHAGSCIPDDDNGMSFGDYLNKMKDRYSYDSTESEIILAILTWVNIVQYDPKEDIIKKVRNNQKTS